MRNIEYRGIRIDTGEMVTGHGFMIDNAMEGNYVYVWSDIRSKWYRVIPESVGEYTGLKDKNGKQLFENDIISYEGITGLIQFSHGIFGIKWFEDSSVMRGMYGQLHDLRRLDDGFNEKIEVIGDMIQNEAFK